jgi:hypothetical protein
MNKQSPANRSKSAERDSSMNIKLTTIGAKPNLTQPQRVSLQLPLLILLTVALLGGALTASAATKT